MADPEVVNLPVHLPESVTVSLAPGQGMSMRLSPNQMRALKAETGKTLDELIGEGADDADRFQAFAWFELRRLGYDARWDQIGDVTVEITSEAPDPTSGGPSTSSPPSAASGA